MKIAGLVALTIGCASAAPAILWREGGASSGPSHISDSVGAQSLLSTVTANAAPASALNAVIFLVGRDAAGSEGLAALTSAGKLPGVREKYGAADEVHHNVDGVESGRTVARDVARAEGNTVAVVSTEEFFRKLSTIAQNTAEEVGETADGKVSKAEQKRRKAISQANVLVVNVKPTEDASLIDAAVVAAIESPSVQNVVLSSIRSVDEVKRSRQRAVMSRFSKSARGRRLDEEANNENGNNNNADESGVYYVNMTPNILAGLLFMFMFVFTAYTGLMCMNMIEGQVREYELTSLDSILICINQIMLMTFVDRMFTSRKCHISDVRCKFGPETYF